MMMKPAKVPNWQIIRIGLRPCLSDNEPQIILPNKLKKELAESNSPTWNKEAPKSEVKRGRYGIKIENPMISMNVEIHNGINEVYGYCLILELMVCVNLNIW